MGFLLFLVFLDAGPSQSADLTPPPPLVIRPQHMEGKWLEKWDHGEELHWIAEYKANGKCSHFDQSDGQSWSGRWWMDNTGALHLMETQDGTKYECQRVPLKALTVDHFKGDVCVEMRRRR